MADPIIFDCGGSTRIKRATAAGSVGAMNGLLDVNDAANPPQSQEIINDTFTAIAIASIDRTGASAQVNINPLPVPTTFLIESEGDQNVQGDVAAATCTITVFGASVAGSTKKIVPLVEAKQFHKKRRYIVANAGAIQRITVNGTVQFTTSASIIYATLILS